MISVKEFRKGNGIYSTGVVEVLYWDLKMYCDIVIFKSRLGTFIKIPQRVEPDGKRVNIIFWSSKEISDAFQEEVKAQLMERFPEALIIPDLREVKKKKNFHKKSLRKNTPLSHPKEFIPGKARSTSKFQK